MSSMTLYSGPLSMYGAKAQIAALEKALPLSLVMVAFSDQHGYDPKHPEVLRINPKGQVPVLVHGEVEIFDSTQIFEYFEHLQPHPPLWPAAAAARARARLLELQSDEVLFPNVIRLMGLQQQLQGAEAQAAIGRVHGYYAKMERLLEDRRQFLAGDYSYADIAFYMAQLFAARLGAPMDADTPRLVGWREQLTQRPAVLPVVRQFVATLTQLQRPVPPFMRDAAASVTP